MKEKIKTFKNKKEVFTYVVDKFANKKGTVILRGSLVSKPVKMYSDFDLEIYIKKPRKPYYEIVKVKDNLCLISIWFGKYKKGGKISSSKKILVLNGDYMDYMKYIPDKGFYFGKSKVKRECQGLIDWMFKYLRTKNNSTLEHIHKRIK